MIVVAGVNENIANHVLPGGLSDCLTWTNARGREENICTRTLNSNTKYVIALALAIYIRKRADIYCRLLSIYNKN